MSIPTQPPSLPRPSDPLDPGRRKILGLLVPLVVAAAMPPRAFAQRSSPPPRVAVVLATAPAAASTRLAAFQQGLKALGYVDGQTIVVEPRSWAAEKRPLADLAAQVVASKPAVIVAEGNPTIAALKRATTTVPLVMAVVGDPVGSGFVTSLARPGGNITGLSNTSEQLSGKRLAILKELVPDLARVGVLHNPSNPTHAIFMRETQAASASLGTRLTAFTIEGEADVDTAFAEMAAARIQGAVVLPQPAVIVLRRQIADIALRHRVPVMFPSPEPVEAGGLVSYGPSHTDLWQRAASYVSRILHGARPADLPIEQPTRFDLVINLKAAGSLGLTVPPALLLQARTIE